MLLTNAKGEQGMKYILYPGSVANMDPTSALSPDDRTDLVTSSKTDAYMDQNLLILDGHNSRLNVNTLVTAAMNNVEILCLPSHLTHLLQPNDANYNHRFKVELVDCVNFGCTSTTIHSNCHSSLVQKSRSISL